MMALADHPVTPWRLNWAMAAQGDIVAQRLLRDFYLDQYGKTSNLDHLDVAELWARAGSEHDGTLNDDRLTLAKIHSISGAWSPVGIEADVCRAEAVGILSDLADAGQEEAASIVNSAIADSSPDFAQLAKSLGAHWTTENFDDRADEAEKIKTNVFKSARELLFGKPKREQVYHPAADLKALLPPPAGFEMDH